MTFAGMNYLAVLIAGIAGWLLGAVYYGLLAGPWVAAHGKTMDEFKAQMDANKGTVHAWLPFALALVAEIAMAWVLAGIVGHLGPGQVTMRNGLITALFVWFGFVVTTMLVNNAFSGRRYVLTAIDAGHWLAVLLVIGAVIGWFGV